MPLLLFTLPAAAGGASAQTPALAPPTVIDGPGSAIDMLGGVAVARDGTGGLVYIKDVLGTPHVFLSRLAGGTFGAPQQVDTGLAGASSQPVLAAGNGGLLLIAFINAGTLYVVDSGSPAAGYASPQPLAAGASNPAISISNFGKAYLAFTAAGSGGHDVRAAYFKGGGWALESAPLDANPADDAGTGTGRPAVATAGDGVAVVVWGEGGHVYSRKVWGISPSTVFEQADLSGLSGWGEVSADQPEVATGGNSSYAAVTFHEVVASGASRQGRVLIRRLRGSQYEGVAGADGLSTPGPDSADGPGVAVDEYGAGFAIASRDASHALFATRVLSNDVPGSVTQVDSLVNAQPSYATVTGAGYFDALIAWQQAPGSAGSPEVRARFFDGTSLGPELVASAPAQGAVTAADGLAAAGDIAADVAIAWVQAAGSEKEIVAAQLYQSPGSPTPVGGFQYFRSSHPVLSWSVPRELWPPLQYIVTVDGVQVATVAATHVAPLLADGPHRWQVTAVNRAGLTSKSGVARLFVDTVAPTVRFKLTGRARAGAELSLVVSASDRPPAGASVSGSGVAGVKVRWGDGTAAVLGRRQHHSYAAPGRYTITITVSDRAGNTATVRRAVTVRGAGTPKHRRGHK